MSSSILSNSIIATAGRMAGGLVGLGITALLARYLGPGLFGSYILLLSFGAVIQLFADAGLYLTLTRDIARSDKNGVSRLVSEIMSLRLVLLLVSFSAGWFISLYVPSLAPFSDVFIVIAIGIAFQSLSQLIMGVFQWRGEIWRAAVGDMIGRVVQLGGLYFLGTGQAGLLLFSGIFAASTATSFAVHGWLLPKGVNLKLAVNWTAWRSLWARSWPLGAMLLLNAVYFRIDAIILSLLRSAEEVGWYGVAYRLIEAGLFFPAMFGGLLLPRLTESLVDKKEIASRYIVESLKLVLLGAGLVVAVVSTLSSGLITFIAGDQYLPAAPLLSILGLALAVMFVGNIFGFSLVAMNRQKTLLKLYAALVVFNIVANIIYIPPFGATAAAVTTLATEFISAAVAAAIVVRHMKTKLPLEYAGRVFIVFAATAAVAVFLPRSWHVSISLAVCCLVYAGLSYAVGTLRLSQVRQLAARPSAA